MQNHELDDDEIDALMLTAQEYDVADEQRRESIGTKHTVPEVYMENMTRSKFTIAVP